MVAVKGVGVVEVVVDMAAAVREEIAGGVMVAAEGMVIVEVALEMAYRIRSLFRR